MDKLGQRVRDRISGYEGIATARHEYLVGCVRISVQAKVRVDGSLPEYQTFDEPQLEILSKTPISVKGNKYVDGRVV